MANTELLDRQVLNAAMEKRSTDEQPLYELEIPANTLNSTSAIRIKAMLARTVNPPSCLSPIDACGYACELGQYAEATYAGSIEIAGPVVRAIPDQDNDTFYGIAALYLPISQLIRLCSFNGEPLSGFGTVIAAATYTLIDGDVLQVKASEEFAQQYLVNVNSLNIITAITISELTTTNPCISFITLEVDDDGTFVP